MAKEIHHLSGLDARVTFDGFEGFDCSLEDLSKLQPIDTTGKACKLFDGRKTVRSHAVKDALGNMVPFEVQLVITRPPVTQSEADLVTLKARQTEQNAEKRAQKDLAATQRTIDAVKGAAVEAQAATLKTLGVEIEKPKSQNEVITAAVTAGVQAALRQIGSGQ